MHFLMPRRGLGIGASARALKPNSAPGPCKPSLAKRIISHILIVSLAGCSLPRYPTQIQVEQESNNVPRLESITDGRAYLSVVRNELQDKREYLQNVEFALDAGILGGLVATGLGTAFHWGGHKTIIAGILTTAVIGLDSTLSLKQQEMIIEKGLGALQCVQAQAEGYYLAVKPYDAALERVRGDVQNLESELASLAVPIRPDLLPVVTSAQREIVNAKTWLSVKSVPVANVDASVKVGVDAVLQTTVEQLNSALPDGSAFAKISISPTLTPAPQQKAGGPAPPPPPPAMAPARAPSEAGPIDPAVAIINALIATLRADKDAADSITIAPGPVNQPSQLQSFNCPVSPLQAVAPLKVSLSSSSVSAKSGTTFTATVSGGVAPYFATVTADPKNTTPYTSGDIGVPQTFTGTTTTLKNSKQIGAGQYTLVITDSTSTVATVMFTETSPPPQPARRPAPAKRN